uniref:Transmembrane protein n=1 Tax=Cyclophora tenuis TaxID=216820 RepID=A0A7S1GMZ7_CYCTE
MNSFREGRHRQQNTLPKFVQFLNTVHSLSIRGGREAVGEVSRLAMTPRFFPYFLAFVMTSSGVTGFVTMNYVQQKQWENRQVWIDEDYMKRHHPNISRNEAMTIAMVEDAKKSTWEQNLDTAFAAHEQFMFGPQNGKEPALLQRLKTRTEELVKTTHPPERRQKTMFETIVS